MFCYDRRESYYDAQDIAPDCRYALMRWSGEPTSWDDLQAKFDRAVKRFLPTMRGRPDRKRQKKGHR